MSPKGVSAKDDASEKDVSGEKRGAHHRWDDIPKERMTDVVERRFVTAERIMLAQVFLKKGAVVQRHTHESEQVTYIVEGALRLWLGDGRAGGDGRTGDSDGEEEFTVRAGEVLTIPSNVPHRAEALEDTLDIDVFSPPRQDWLDGSDAYLREGSRR